MISRRIKISTIAGFTLIELLVVVAILGILSSIIVISLNNSRRDARDSLRKSQVDQIRKAMQMYALENGGNFPTPQSMCGISNNAGVCLGHSSAQSCFLGWNGTRGCDAMNSAIEPYMKKIPDDPVNDTSYYGDAYYYGYNPNATLPNPAYPLLHWGVEKNNPTSSDCLNGTVGSWPNGKKHCTVNISL